MKPITLATVVAIAGLSACASGNIPAATHSTTPTLGGQWQIVRIDDQVTEHPNYRLSFDAQQQRFAAFFGCNRIMGSYVQQGSQLQLTHIASTRMACLNSAHNENAGIAALAAVRSAQLHPVKTSGGGLRLNLLDAGGNSRIEAQPLMP